MCVGNLLQSKLVLVRLDVLETFNDRYEEFRCGALCCHLYIVVSYPAESSTI